ncbi:PepSY domain-containing protein [Sphingomonas sp. ABOLE]|uniref:PepSY-associated TM helix domain-containing protein n=1 Tax=Sphingomonas sp. ABOLE TaxID=1985878 RepID=UPI000F7FA2B7|nr:PepSY-associated TM helix domain-containing protein [Sphingomonas sp. ABOLE]RSV35833.1 PepSY domain-containing protein [Sphingomonas sp. ABOLE]
MSRTGNKGLALAPDVVRAVLKGHSSLGLAFAAVLYLVCLTGALAVFVAEFTRWENPAAPRVATLAPDALPQAYAEALAKAGGPVDRILMVLPKPENPLLRVRTEAQGAGQREWFADRAGHLAAPVREGWTELLVRLHVNLHLPRAWGGFLVGLAGVALLSSLISGILAHPRIFRDAFQLRLGGSRRLQEADLHNRIGVWALPFHLIVSLTGALLGLSTVIIAVLGMVAFQGNTARVYALFRTPRVATDTRPAPPLDLRPMLADAARRVPTGRIDYLRIEHPARRDGSVELQVEDGSHRIAGTDAYGYDRQGRLYHAKRAAENNLGGQILGSLGPLHFGWFAGPMVKIAYGLLGFGLAYLASGGVLLWIARRRDRGRPVPGWERIWVAFAWGQPLALAAGALGAVAAPAMVLVPLLAWASTSLAMLAVAAAMAARPLARFGRGGTGLVLTLIAMVHGGWRSADAMVAAVNLVLLAVGAALMFSATRPANAPLTGGVNAG